MTKIDLSIPKADVAVPLGSDADIRLLLPVDDVLNPEVTIVVPALDEELTITDFVVWCKEGLGRAGATGEILIVDSSSDRTAELALQHGARVLRVPKRGLGRAYIDAVPYLRGRYVIMGDADCTYDFRRLGAFVDRMREGYEFAMGSRWAGTIEAGSMPRLHRYFGTPLTTWILNRVYGSHFTDIHCGMRGMSRDALVRMGLTSQSWEYASEMVLKSVRMELRTAEVPVAFLKDRDGRVSHHKRSGWFSPFHAAWINLRAMFIYGADFFTLKPGIVLLAIGLLLTLPLSVGAIRIGSVTFDLYWMLVGVTFTVLGLNSFFFGCLAQVFCDYTGRARRRWAGLFRYTQSTVLSAVVFLIGLGFVAAIAIHWASSSGTLPGPRSALDHLAIIGLMLMISGFSLFCFTLVLHATAVRYGPGPTCDD